MLPQLIKYIRDHAKSWPVKLKAVDQLTPLFRFNREANGIVQSEQIGTIVFWFTEEKRNPCLVSKIFDNSLSVEYIKTHGERQREINKKIGISVFPTIYDIAKIGGYPVIFQEAINAPNYEIELSKAIYGPSGNLSILKEVVDSHFKEISVLLNHLKMIDVSEEMLQWGDWAYSVGNGLRNNYGLRLEFLTDNCLDRMKKEINSMCLQRNYVLVDHHCANYFRGPRVVDQIDRSLTERMSNEPGIIDVFRFIIAYFRASPLNAIYKDWLSAIAFSITDKNGSIITGLPVQRLLHDLGLNTDEPRKIWALVMVSFFLRTIDELTFHEPNIFLISRLRAEFELLTKRLIEIQDIIEKDGNFDFSFVLRSQESFIPPSKPMPTDNAAQSPYLIEEGYKEFNIVLCRGKYYAVSRTLGPIDFTCLEEHKVKEYQEGGKWFIGDSFEEVKHLVDERVGTLEKELVELDKNKGLLKEEVSDKETKINILRGVNVSFSAVPVLLDSYEGYNVVQFKDRIYGISQALGHLDLLEEEESLNKYEEDGKCMIGDSISEVKHLVDRLLYQASQRSVSEKNKSIESLSKDVSDRDENIRRLVADIEERNEKLNALQGELEGARLRIEALIKDGSNREEKVNSLKLDILELSQKIDILNEVVNKKERESAELHGWIKGLQEELADITSKWWFRLFKRNRK